MIVLTHHVVPKPNHPEYAKIAGGYAVSFVNHTDLAVAAKVAEADIDEIWEVESLEESSAHEREDYLRDTENLVCYEQALIDFVVTIIHTYPRKRKKSPTGR